MEKYKEEIIRFVQKNLDKTPEEIKKALRNHFPSGSFYSDDIEKYIIEANARRRGEDFDR